MKPDEMPDFSDEDAEEIVISGLENDIIEPDNIFIFFNSWGFAVYDKTKTQIEQEGDSYSITLRNLGA